MRDALLTMTPDDVQVRRDICKDCTRACDVRDTINHADPCQGCPQRVYHKHSACVPDAPQPAREHAPATDSQSKIVSHHPSDSLLRRYRAYKRASFPLVATATRHGRRDACAACEFRKETTHKGLYGCSARSCGCGGGDEFRMVFKKSKCVRWPSGTSTESPAQRNSG